MHGASIAWLRERMDSLSGVRRPDGRRISSGILPLDDLLADRTESRVPSLCRSELDAHQNVMPIEMGRSSPGFTSGVGDDIVEGFSPQSVSLKQKIPGGVARSRCDEEKGSFRAGSTVEWLSRDVGCGEMSLALLSAFRACADGRVLVVFDRAGEIYPPALCSLGWDERRTIWVRCANEPDELWGWEQALGSRGVGAVIGRVGRIGDRHLRRMQLAAERGQTLGILLRPAEVRDEPSWSDVRLLVESMSVRRPLLRGWSHSAGRRLRIAVLRARGPGEGKSIEVLWDEETRTVSVAPELADSTSSRRSASA